MVLDLNLVTAILTGNIVSDFFAKIGEVIQGLLGNLTTAMQGVVALFWSAENGFTIFGVLLLIAVGGGLVWFAFGLIRSFLGRAGRTN